MLPDDIVALARRVVEENAAAGRKVAVAESCTGGLVAAALTEIAGSSAVLDRGFAMVTRRVWPVRAVDSRRRGRALARRSRARYTSGRSEG